MLKWAFSRLWNEELVHRELSLLYFIVQMCSIQQFFIRLTTTLITPSVFNLSNILLVCAIKHTSVNHGQWCQLVQPSLRYHLKPRRWWTRSHSSRGLLPITQIYQWLCGFTEIPASLISSQFTSDYSIQTICEVKMQTGCHWLRSILESRVSVARAQELSLGSLS